MNGDCCCGARKFIMGMAVGMTAGTALGMTMAPSRRKIRRMANRAAKWVNEAVESLADAMEM